MLRSLARWPGRRLVLLWLALALLEGGLWLAGRRADQQRRANSLLGPGFDRAPARPLTPAGRDSLAAFVLAATRPLDSAATRRRDSAFDALGRGGSLPAAVRDSLRAVAGIPTTVTPAQRDSAVAAITPMLDGLFHGVRDAFNDWRFIALLVAAALVVYGAPLALLLVTGLWLLARRRYPPASTRPGVA